MILLAEKVMAVALLMILLFIAAGDPSGVAGHRSSETDKIALLEIKSQITEDPLQVTSSWNESLHFCQWRGVTCDPNHRKRVTELSLRSLSLKGFLSPSIGNLSFIRSIDLFNNSFQGEIPYQIGRLFRLQQIVLEKNLLGGQIPTSLSNCSHLRVLNLGFNQFSGNIPSEIGSLSNLVQLTLVANKLEGSIPLNLGNLSSLQELNISANNLDGNIPASLGHLKSLIHLGISKNKLSGMVPQSIYNLSYLESFIVSENQLHGFFPHNIGSTLPNIRIFRIWGNQFSGRIPISFSNFSNLEEFDITSNNFVGGLPAIFGDFKKLMWVDITLTSLGSGKADDLDFLTSFTNCTNLIYLQLQENNFGGVLPNSIGNLSATLEFFSVGGNQISGNIPPSVGNLVGLKGLGLYENRLTGAIPTTIGKLYNLVRLYLGSNELSGEIPSSFGNLTVLNNLALNYNNLQGNIPSNLGNCRSLQLLFLHNNFLNGSIPPNVIGLSSLSLSLVLSRNRLTGTLPPEVGKLKNLIELELSHNELSGNIPKNLGDCVSLQWLRMDHNKFEGTIDSLSSLKVIEEIDLSNNNLSGKIPKEFTKLVFLSMLNLSYNDLEGQVPIGGIFNVSMNISLVGNDKLCGGIAELSLPPCSKMTSKKRNKLYLARKLIISIICGIFGLCLVSYLLIRCWFRRHKKESSESSWNDVPFLNISYGELLKATNGFSLENLIGTGSFSSVFKGILEQDQLCVAVKVFNLQKRGASKSFMAECETLKSIRHRNLVKIISACSSVDYQGNDFKALIYEFMSNGSLEDWLYPKPQIGEYQMKILTFSQRLNMIVDVALALDYLHNQGEMPIVHCDLKPSNILLDQDMTVHVADFGLSRIMEDGDTQTSQPNSSSVAIRGTIGYAAPEYAMGRKVSTEGDVYSFGILLLEIFTGKRPTDDHFEDGLSLNQLVKRALHRNLVRDIVDQSLMMELGQEEEEASSSNTSMEKSRRKIYECVVSILAIGINCSEESLRERMKISDVLKKLQGIKSVIPKSVQGYR
ncbi:probable LRR receptor-like serine/threonine-protein kinase At3g47570 [Humulus lupulus]|uniref:probable LRR receptor-like serine/threonine-protein kinase At3g47570 n=1 Tax=Humulus lupulus TaxID=3486 RepID=UPI002B40ED2B|nr:probable LRR receptor-like serine/threonine-protein kinase At3g47570 [Humulus lupulus]